MSTSANSKGRLQTLASTVICQRFQAVFDAGLPIFLPLVRQDLGLTYVQTRSLALASLHIYAIMQIPAGYLSDRYLPQKIVATGTLDLMGSSLLFAFAKQYWLILGIQFFWGFFGSLFVTPSTSVFIRWFSLQRRTTAASLPLGFLFNLRILCCWFDFNRNIGKIKYNPGTV